MFNLDEEQISLKILATNNMYDSPSVKINSLEEYNTSIMNI